MKVHLLEIPRNPQSLIYAAYRQCYSSQSAADIFTQESESPEKAAHRFIQNMIQSGHESPLEHVTFTFAVEGISRAATHQLVRHRIASYSQQSQRYVNASDFDYIVPPSIAGDPAMLREFTAAMEVARAGYNRLLMLLKDKGRERAQATEDARYVLPQAVETKIVVSMNCRELLHFFRLRCCNRAQWEIRTLANRMLELCRLHLSAVFGRAGAACEVLGHCPEDERFSCGRYPVMPRRVIHSDSR